MRRLCLFDPTVSDHALILCDLTVANPTSYEKSIVFYNYRNINHDVMKHEICHHLALNANLLLNSERLVYNYNNLMLNLQDKFCPQIEKTITVREDGP